MKFLIYLILLLAFNTTFIYSQTRIYVNPATGNDDGNDGRNILFPLKTIERAGYVCHGGDTIFIRGGHYKAFHDFFWQSDTSNSLPIWIMPYFNGSVSETVILDGAGYSFPNYIAVLSIEHAKNIIVKDLIIRNNNTSNDTVGGSGLRAVTNPPYLTRKVLFKNCKVSNVFRQGILVQANDVIVDSCEVYNAVLSNFNNQIGLHGGWDFAVGTIHYPPTIKAWTNIVFRKNKIYNSWGEGIDALRCYNFLIENNHVYDCFSAYIYIDNSRKGIIRNNWIHSTNNTFNRLYDSASMFYAPGVGIQWAAEMSNYGVDSLISDLEIYNNLIVRTNSPISWWRATDNNFTNNSYKNINVYNNTIYKTFGYQSFYLDPNTTNIVTPTNCNFKNNIVCMGQYPFNSTYRLYITTNSSHISSWNFSNNCFANGSSISVQGQNNVFGAPSFIDSTNINIDFNFKINSTSNCRDNAVPISGINKDYFNLLRDNISPSIGFHEYGGTSGIGSNATELSMNYMLLQNFPNPFNPYSVIEFNLPKASNVNLIVYDIFGREVKKLISNEFKNIGLHSIIFDGSNYSSGIYFYRLVTEKFDQTKKMILLK